MTTIASTTEIAAPVQAVYDTFTSFEDFPRFVPSVVECRRLTPTRLRWTARIGGVTRQWDAEIVEQIPPREVAWRALDGAAHAGTVSFEPTDRGTTVLSLAMRFDPLDWIERTGDALGIVRRHVASAIDRFKGHVEARRQEPAR